MTSDEAAGPVGTGQLPPDHLGRSRFTIACCAKPMTSSRRVAKALCTDATCSAVSFASTDKLHERVCAPFTALTQWFSRRQAVADEPQSSSVAAAAATEETSGSWTRLRQHGDVTRLWTTLVKLVLLLSGGR